MNGKSEDSQHYDTRELSQWTMFKNLVNCTFQTVFGYICLDVCVAISLHYISQGIGSIANAGYGFALTCVFILLTPIGFGFNQSLNMQAAQALGNKKVKLAKRFYNINIYVMLCALIPFSVLILSLKYPLSFAIAKEDREETSDYAQQFLFYLIPAIILAILLESAKIFMMAHKITYPFTFIHFTTLLTHWFFSWLFIMEFEWGVFGAGIVIIITEVFNIIGLFLFIQFTSIKQEVFQDVKILPDLKSIRKLGFQYFKTSLPIVLHIISEYIVFFLLAFAALSLGTAEMNAHLGLQTTNGVCFRIPISLSIALMAFVGTEMGKGSIKNAKSYVKMGIFIFFIACLIYSTVVWVLKKQLAVFFSGHDEYEEETRELYTETIPWLIIGTFAIDGYQCSLTGALKGMNLTNFVFYSTTICYYVIYVPLLGFFTYSWGLDKGLVGIWQAFAVTNVLLAILYTIILFITNWEKESSSIVQRVKKENEMQKSTIVQMEENLYND